MFYVGLQFQCGDGLIDDNGPEPLTSAVEKKNWTYFLREISTGK